MKDSLGYRNSISRIVITIFSVLFLEGCSGEANCSDTPYLFTEEVSLEDAYWSVDTYGRGYFKGVRLKGVIEPTNCIEPNIKRIGFVVGLDPNPTFDLNILSENKSGGAFTALPNNGKVNTIETQFPPEYTAYWYANYEKLIGSKWYVRAWYEDENGHYYGNQVTFTIPQYP